MRRVAWLCALGCAVAAHGCALEPGEGFARLEPGTLRAAFEIGPARALAENRLLTDEGYRVELARCRLTVRDFELQSLDARSGGGDASFDPADPPDGYSLCHGGHCHAADGSLVSYDEVQARLAGGNAVWKPVARVTLGAELDLLAPSARALARWEPATDLPEVSIARAVLRLEELQCEGRVEGDALPAARTLEVALPLSAANLHVSLDQPISRDGPASLAPAVRLRIDGTLFDRIDFAARASAAGDGPVVLEREDVAALESFVGAVALTVQLRTGKD